MIDRKPDAAPELANPRFMREYNTVNTVCRLMTETEVLNSLAIGESRVVMKSHIPASTMRNAASKRNKLLLDCKYFVIDKNAKHTDRYTLALESICHE